MPDDPFADLGVDRTVIMPAPGGRSAPARPAPPAPPPEPVDAGAVPSGLNPLIAAANSILDVVPQLRASVQHPNPAGLRDRLAQDIRQFETRARGAGASTEKIVAARYAICTLVDETAASTPWGASGAWAQHGMLALFHGETEGGQKFFQVLARLAENPQANIDVLELMYVCLQLGFEGRYRIVDDGHRQLEAIRERLLSIIRQQRGEYERDLSPSWQGVPVAEARLGWLSLWVVVAVAALALVGVYVGFRWSLSDASDRLAGQIAGLRLAGPPVSAAAPPAPRPAPAPRLGPLLTDEVKRGLVTVDDRPDRSIVTILGGGLFKPGDAAVSSEDQGLLMRIGEALAKVPGQVDVIGYTDNVPIRTLRFPSNWELSKARAESVARFLATHGVDRARIAADGRGESEPLASNDTPEGRARNRRVEITLHVPAGGAAESATARTPGKP
jgi:type VI secretion system protein ImpK